MEKEPKISKKEKVAKKKEHIIDALKRLLENSVYSQISIEDVATEAGLSKGGLRHYFPTREELYVGLIEDFFFQIENDYTRVVQDLESEDKAFVATLFDIERFLMDKKNIRIFINFVLYGFEDEKIMFIIKKFIRNHLNLFQEIVEDSSSDSEDGIDSIFISRIIQIIVFGAGLFEFIDPVDIDPPKLIDYILKLSTGKNN